MDVTTLNLLMGAVGAGNGIANAFADISQGNFIAQQFKFNQQIADIQGQEATLQGQEQQQVSQERTAELSGSQIGAEAAQGVDVHTGTSAITRQQTSEIGALDYLTIGNNAFLKTLGFKIQGVNDSTQAGMAQNAGQFKASQSLLGGAEELFQGTMKAIDYNQMPTNATTYSENKAKATNDFGGGAGPG